MNMYGRSMIGRSVGNETSPSSSSPSGAGNMISFSMLQQHHQNSGAGRTSPAGDGSNLTEVVAAAMHGAGSGAAARSASNNNILHGISGINNNINNNSTNMVIMKRGENNAAPSPPSRYESQKRRDWNTFGQYLKNHRPPLALSRCSGAHVLEFLRYLDHFGKTKVHVQGCPFFGQPQPPAPCGCPLRQAWGSLDALIGRLRAAYEENGGKPETNPFGARAVRLYLREVRELQAKARGIAYEKKKRKRPTASSSNTATSSTSGNPGTGHGTSTSAANGSLPHQHTTHPPAQLSRPPHHQNIHYSTAQLQQLHQHSQRYQHHHLQLQGSAAGVGGGNYDPGSVTAGHAAPAAPPTSTTTAADLLSSSLLIPSFH